MCKELLPIGSVVLIGNSKKKVMILMNLVVKFIMFMFGLMTNLAIFIIY
jgi:hypothetical protein